MSVNQWKLVLLLMFIPVFGFLFYHDFYLFTREGKASQA